MGGDGFTTPSEPTGSTLSRFFTLRPLSCWGLARASWIVALIVFALEIVAYFSRFPASYGTADAQERISAIVIVAVPMLLRLLEPVLWLRIVRLVIEVTLAPLRPREDRLRTAR